MKTIAVRLKKLTDTKEARLRELQERFSKLVLEAMTFCPPDAGEKALLQGVRRELLEMGLPERYALAGAVQAARLLREWSGVQSRPDMSRVWGFMQLRPGDGRWYALFRVYETRPRQWVVPLHIRAGGVS
jgi:hypothetical protein